MAIGTNPFTNNTVSASLTFALPGDPGCAAAAGSVCATLTNTTANGTVNRADVLATFFFDVSGANPVLALASGSGTVVQSGQAPIPNSDLNAATAGKGRYALVGNPGGTLGTNANGVNFPYEYGVSTVGDTGIFPGGTVGNDDYAIVAPGTNLSISGLSGLSLVDTVAFFVISGFGGGSLSQITNVAIAFGSAPDVVLAARSSIPEPPLVWPALVLLTAGVWARRRRA